MKPAQPASLSPRERAKSLETSALSPEERVSRLVGTGEGFLAKDNYRGWRVIRLANGIVELFVVRSGNPLGTADEAVIS
jgi:hypothetical protein